MMQESSENYQDDDGYPKSDSRNRRIEQREMITHHHVSTFILTFISFAFVHASRKSFSNVKESLIMEWTPTNMSDASLLDYDTWNSHHLFEDHAGAEIFLGTLDTIFMTSYAVGLFISGIIGDRVDLRIFLSTGMCLSAITGLIFGSLTEWLHFYNRYFYIFLWILNGLFQSTSWPIVIAVMGNWFSKNKRGMILGAWSSCSSIGNILGAYAVATVIPYGYEWSFTVPSTILFCNGIVVFFGLVAKPEDLGLPKPSEENEPSPTDSIESEGVSESEPLLGNPEQRTEPKVIGFFQALRLPGVLMYSLCYACLKFVYYAFFFWLPYYLTNNFHWSEITSARVSVWNDIGSIFGAIIGGVISDKICLRSPVVMIMLIAAIPSLYCFSVSPNNVYFNGFLMTLVGCFVGGTSNLIGTAVTADLGRQDALKDNSAALATVTGIVDGIGSLGAAIGQLVVPVAEQSLGWHNVFNIFIIMIILAGFVLVPAFKRDCTELLTRWRIRRSYESLQSM